ncbi:MAG: hypothetical protein U0525_04765 [Patescibacteria group bacterium]
MKMFHKKENLIIFVFAVVYFFTALSFILPSGLKNCDLAKSKCEIEVAIYHAHDAFWHMAIAENSFKSFPPKHPIYFGTNLSHYNYLFDLLLFLVKKIFGVPIIVGYFQLFPVVTSVLYIAGTFLVLNKLNINRSAKIFTALFLFLGNSFAFIMTIFTRGNLVNSAVQGFPLVLTISPINMFYNNQFALSLPIILFGVHLLKAHENRSKYLLIWLATIIFLLTWLKVYAAFALMLYTFFYLVIRGLKNTHLLRRNIFMIAILAVVLFATSYVVGGGGKGVFTYDPLAFIRSLIDDPSHMFREQISLARTTLESSGKFSIRLVLMYVTFILLFYLINFGARILGVFAILYWVKDKKIPDYVVSSIFATLILSIIPMFILQKGDWFNTMQFLYYGVFFSCFVAGYALSRFPGKFKKLVFVLIFISILIPTIDQLRISFNSKKVVVDSDFIDAALYLSRLPFDGVSIYGKGFEDSRLPAFSGKSQMIGDLPVLENTFVNYRSRYEEQKKLGYVKKSKYIFIDIYLNPDWNKKLKTKKLLFKNKHYALVENN